MGLDFGIEKRRMGAAYKGLAWEKVHDSWRNCYEVKDIFCKTIETNDTYYYPITIGAMQVLVKKLTDQLQEENFNNMGSVDEYRVNKLLLAISDLFMIIRDALWEYQEGIEYEYRVYQTCFNTRKELAVFGSL